VGTGTVHVLVNDTGPDDADHAPEALYLLAAESVGRVPAKNGISATSHPHTSSSAESRCPATWKAEA
jgi:hypothetical protein